MKKISIISPAFNEERNLPELHAELIPALESLGMEWEWTIIDDHSSDKTPEIIKQLSKGDSRIRGLRMEKNQGSHALCLFGLSKASGDCAALLASDGQDPPENLARLTDEMKKSGCGIVWLTRGKGREDPFFKRLAAWGFYFVMRRIMGVSSIPPGGGDMVLVDRAVLGKLREIKRKNINLLTAIAELDFSQSYVAGKRRERVHGKSNFTFVKNIGLFFDTLTTLNSAAPLRRMSFLGFAVFLAGFLHGINFFISAVLVLCGAGMSAFGIIGEYFWRSRADAPEWKPEYTSL